MMMKLKALHQILLFSSPNFSLKIFPSSFLFFLLESFLLSCFNRQEISTIEGIGEKSHLLVLNHIAIVIYYFLDLQDHFPSKLPLEKTLRKPQNTHAASRLLMAASIAVALVLYWQRAVDKTVTTINGDFVHGSLFNQVAFQ